MRKRVPIEDSMLQYGFYSEMARLSGAVTVFWSTPEGDEVEVNFVCDTQRNTTGWKDIVCLGVVVKYLRPGACGPVKKKTQPNPIEVRRHPVSGL